MNMTKWLYNHFKFVELLNCQRVNQRLTLMIKIRRVELHFFCFPNSHPWTWLAGVYKMFTHLHNTLLHSSSSSSTNRKNKKIYIETCVFRNVHKLSKFLPFTVLAVPLQQSISLKLNLLLRWISQPEQPFLIVELNLYLLINIGGPVTYPNKYLSSMQTLMTDYHRTPPLSQDHLSHRDRHHQLRFTCFLLKKSTARNISSQRMWRMNPI